MEKKLLYYHLTKRIQEKGFDCEEWAQEEIQEPHLLVPLWKDLKGRERSLHLSLMEVEQVNEDPKHPHAYHLHFYVQLPFSFEDDSVGEVARLILLYNKSVEFPGFGLDEVNRQVYFRYSLPIGFHSPSADQLQYLISVIALLVDALSDPIEAVAAGRSMKEVIQEVLA